MDENTDDSSMDKEQPPPERKERKLKCFHLFNCDETYKLDIVEKLLDAIKEKVTSFDISTATKKSFRLFEMSELCTTIRSGPPMDFAIFVVHANESRLSINEENAGIGYARFYKALQQATGELVFTSFIRIYKNHVAFTIFIKERGKEVLIRKSSYKNFRVPEGRNRVYFNTDKRVNNRIISILIVTVLRL